MNIYTLGVGFVASHLPYPQITDRIAPNQKQISDLLDKYKPDVLVNCIGRCGNPNVEQCELIKEETLLANTIIPSIVATECEKRSIHFVNISSGCIYYGPSPNNKNGIDIGYVEKNFANPLSYYSKTKYACDLLLGQLKNTTTVRIRMPISDKPSPRNLITKLLKYNKVLVEPNSVSFLDDIVRAVDFLAINHKTGIYHVAQPEPMTHDQLLEEYRIYHPEHIYARISASELEGMISTPRSNCILDVSKIESEGFSFMPTSEALKTTMKRYISNEKV